MDDNKNTASLLEEYEKQELYDKTLIEFNKETYKNLISVYYSSIANYDKLIITIFFAEMGYIVHSVKDKAFHISFLIPLLVCGIGVYLSFKKYNIDTKLLIYEKNRVYSDMLKIFNINRYENDIINLDSSVNLLMIRSQKINFWISFMLGISALTTIETVFFITQERKSLLCLIISVVLPLVVAMMFYFSGEKKWQQ